MVANLPDPAGNSPPAQPRQYPTEYRPSYISDTSDSSYTPYRPYDTQYTTHTESTPSPYSHQPIQEGVGNTAAPPYVQEKPKLGGYTISSTPIPQTPSPHPPLREQTDVDEPLLSPSSASGPQIIATRGHSWNLEIVSLFISFVALAALIALLIYVNGRPLSEWKGSVSVNAVISGLGAVSRTSLAFAISSCLGQAKWNWLRRRPDNLVAFDRFDEASRGPWGSVWLIIWLRVRHWVAIGALVTILLMAFEPFMQAVISFPGRIDLSADSSMIQLGRSEALAVGSYAGDPSTGVGAVQLTPSKKTISLDPYAALPDLGMLSAFNNGFYNSSSNDRPSASFTCPTANCTWPVFTSLAVCSSCSNITSHLKLYKEHGENLGTLSSYSMALITDYTIHSLPLVNLSNPNMLDLEKDKTLFSLVAYMAGTAVTDPKRTLAHQNLDTMITAAQILKAAPGYEAGTLQWTKTPVTATECALYFCVNAYESAVEKGVLKENVVASWAERDFNTYRDLQNTPNFDAFEKWNNHSLYSAYGDVVRSDLELFIPAEDLNKYNLTQNTTLRYKLTENTVGSTVKFVNENLLTSTMTWPRGGNTEGVPVAQALYQSQDLWATFDQVASTVSNWMRDVSNVTNPGVGQEWVIHIHVNWYYMILPLITMSLGFLFCMWSIFDTHQLHLHPFKTSMIATLMHSVDTETRAQLRDADKFGRLKKAIKVMTVKFEDNGSGLELRTKGA